MGQHPHKANRKDPICFSKYLYRARNLVERFFNKIKHFRRIATRYDKLAENFLAALKLAAIRIWLRDNERTPYIFERGGHGSLNVGPPSPRSTPPNTEPIRCSGKAACLCKRIHSCAK